ncbi:hypothetical protein ABEB36_011888 [Hypothenemus hampei]|uniref:Shootin-1 n=1 Tax=Hypothenemus hampei TaxID=57062 RepID=A0ABD1E9D9_HYPHA
MENNINSLLATRKVHYEGGGKSSQIAISDCPTETELYSKSSIPRNYSGDGNSEISIDTSILDVEDFEGTKKRLEECEQKLKFLENENKTLNEDLAIERKKSVKLEKKLQFVKDNQEVFMRLKEAYINMKYNEAAGRKMIEIREKSIQTWEGTLCSCCIETEELRRQIEIALEKYHQLFVVSPGEMEHLINTVKYLKDLINRREETWEINFEREHKLQGRIAILENENAKIRDMIANKCPEHEKNEVLEEMRLEQKLLEERKVEEMQKFIESITKDMEKLKKIVIKFEKKFRELREDHKIISPLNDKETRLVQQIILKYNVKIQKKQLDETKKPQNRRPCSPLRSSSQFKDDTTDFETPRKDSAILLMDYLFE